tara:strand:- start:34 stop:576 length:543 start_codon:yes stop_codon:yes gene_type:complete
MKRCRDDEESDDEENESVCAVDNNIYFYTEVTRESVLRLCKLLGEQSKKHEALTLHVHSEGGCAFSGLAAMDMISTLNVTTIAEGLCASAATFILLAGKRRLMTRHSVLLIHEIASIVGWSKYTELKAELQNNELLMDMIISIYKSKSSLKKKAICKMLKDDKYIDSTTALQYGLIDCIA